MTTMTKLKTFVLHSTDFNSAFEKVLSNVSVKPIHLKFLVEAETTRIRFFRMLHTEETGHNKCTPEKATQEGEQILLLLDRLFYLLDETPKNHRLVLLLAVSTGVWIAQRKGEISELELIVTGIASFANHSIQQSELDELYEISLHILLAADDYLKVDLDKGNTERPWRFLCLNHCIIATRTGNGDLARMAYDRLIKYLPEEAEDFFKTGMQKVKDGQYTLNCRNIIQAYYQMYSSHYLPQKEMTKNLN